MGGNHRRTHRLLGKDAPLSRAAQLIGRIESRPLLRGLHHLYLRILFSAHTGASEKFPSRIDPCFELAIHRRRSSTVCFSVAKAFLNALNEPVAEIPTEAEK
jgi:hypothetical protein